VLPTLIQTSVKFLDLVERYLRSIEEFYQFCVALALKGLGHAFYYVFERLKRLSHQLNSKNDSLVLLLKTIFRH